MKKTLNANQIKTIAIAAMTLDHVAWLLFPGYPREPLPLILHILGRITCPIMCFFVAEGYYHTRNIKKYTVRLFLFALLSHFAYVFALADFVDWHSFIPFYYGIILNQTSVMWSLACGLVMLRVANSSVIRRNSIKVLLIVLLCIVSFPSDWSCTAGLCILSFGTNRGKCRAQVLWMLFYVGIYAAVYSWAIDPLYGVLQMAVVLAVPILWLYNGQRSSKRARSSWEKWFFYAYYPVHLGIIGWLQYMR